MNTPILEVHHLSKKYTYTLRQPYDSLRDAITGWVSNNISLTHSVKKTVKTNEFWAIRDISFNLNTGDVIGVIGGNGAGKSTLLKLISRITPPTSGKIILRGRVASLLEIGTGFNPELTGEENIYLSGAILGMKQAEIKERFDQIVRFAGISKFLDTQIKHYSSGMYTRLAFSVAAYLESEILLVDEVLAVGDLEFQKKCLNKMYQSGQSGRTIIFVSHNMSAIKSLCKRTILISNGKLEKFGDTDEVVHSYMSGHSRKTNEGVWNLQSFPRSNGSTPLILKSWVEEDTTKRKVSEVIMGSRINICFTFKSPKPLHDPGFGCDIYSIYGHRICCLTSYLISRKHFPAVSMGTVEFTVHELTLLPGRYVINFSLSEGKIHSFDNIDSAMEFTVLPYDVFSSGIMMESGHGMIYLKAEVNISEGV